MMERLFSKYKRNQVVIYGDILGFKSFIDENSKNDNLPVVREGLRCYVDVFHELDTSIFTDEFRERTGLNFIWLSDSFAFAGDISKWEDIKSKFIHFACELYCMGFTFKGAITFGNMHNEANMMGKPLVDATIIEGELHMPEVQISQEALKSIPFLKEELYSKDNKVFFDYLYVLFKQRVERGCFEPTLHVVAEVCIEGLKKDNHIRQKYFVLIKNIFNALEKLHITLSEDKKAIEDFKNKLKNYKLCKMLRLKIGKESL